MRWLAGFALLFVSFVGFSPAHAEIPRPTSGDGEDKKVLCSYLLYGAQERVCGKPPLKDVQKKCDEKATKDRGSSTKCTCTQDQSYIGDACD